MLMSIHGLLKVRAAVLSLFVCQLAVLLQGGSGKAGDRGRSSKGIYSSPISSLVPTDSSQLTSDSQPLGIYSSPVASLVLTDSSQLTSDNQHLAQMFVKGVRAAQMFVKEVRAAQMFVKGVRAAQMFVKEVRAAQMFVKRGSRSSDVCEKGSRSSDVCERGCYLNISNTLPVWQPVVITRGELVVPQAPTNWSAAITLDGRAILACPGKRNKMALSRGNDMNVACRGGDQLEVDGKVYPARDLGCTKATQGKALDTEEECADHATILQLGFEVKKTVMDNIIWIRALSTSHRDLNPDFFPVIGNTVGDDWYPMVDICHDSELSSSLYSQHTLYGSGLSRHDKIVPGHSSFEAGDSYVGFSPSQAYKKLMLLNVLSLLKHLQLMLLNVFSLLKHLQLMLLNVLSLLKHLQLMLLNVLSLLKHLQLMLLNVLSLLKHLQLMLFNVLSLLKHLQLMLLNVLSLLKHLQLMLLKCSLTVETPVAHVAECYLTVETPVAHVAECSLTVETPIAHVA
uniref:Uncharacterized protein n=1 Tax=Timema douglasi TaxID=61478 RepID=A0A7R8VM70_TIMDO|nr:unnamed protein product [Timema douglasi]